MKHTLTHLTTLLLAPLARAKLPTVADQTDTLRFPFHFTLNHLYNVGLEIFSV